MERIQAYSKDAMVKVKQWIQNKKEKGNAKFFEIFVDGKKVVEKTDNTDQFGDYEIWVHDKTEMIRVIIYELENSPRRTFFCFRTEYYNQQHQMFSISHTSDLENKTLKEENKMLKSKLRLADDYIPILEKEIMELKSDKSKRQNSDVNGAFVNLLNTITDKVKQAA